MPDPVASIRIADDDPSQGWRRAVWLVAALFVARVAYLWLFNSWELAADEAHYWEWSRRLDWSYYTKGPGVAWVIWLSTHAFGQSEAAVRLPSAIASALMVITGARLAYEISGRRGEAALNAAVALTLAPAYFALAQLMTIDGFWSAGWVISTWFVFCATRPNAPARNRVTSWIAAGLAIGITCLFKYTALFFLPGVGLFLLLRRRELRWDRATVSGIAGALIAMLIAMTPIVIWNAQRGWPTIGHQVGRVRLPGGDETVDWSWSPMWFLSFAGAQLALVSVVGVVLIVLAARRECGRAARERDGVAWLGANLLLCVSLPLLAFYLALSVVRQTQGNWAVAGCSTLLVLVGVASVDALQAHRALVRRWLALPQPRPRAGTFTRRPETPFQVLWHWYVGIGVAAAVVIAMGPRLLQLPPLSKIEPVRRANARISGAREHAREIGAIAEANRDARGRLPLLITSRYQEASLLAFYLPGQPVTYSAASRLGSRRNAYDFFADTNLDDPKLHGRRALLLGGGREQWQRALGDEPIRPVAGGPKVLLLEDFRGFADDVNHR